ncbi:MAG: hypothetical protein AAB536_03385 [Patescibacteria group bacterium]
MNQKGFANIALVVLVVVLVGVAGYFVLVKKQEPVAQQTTPPPVTMQPPTLQQPSPTPVNETASWKTYVNNKYGFEVKLDPSWQMVYLKNGTSTDRPEPDMADFISIKNDGKCQCSISIEETSSKNRQARWDETIVSKKSMEIAGLTAEDVISVIEDTKFRTVTAFRPKDNNSHYKFVFSTYQNSSEIFSTPKFDLMLSTFKFTR